MTLVECLPFSANKFFAIRGSEQSGLKPCRFETLCELATHISLMSSGDFRTNTGLLKKCIPIYLNITPVSDL